MRFVPSFDYHIGIIDHTSNPKTYDVIIVGSGPAGVHAAYPLVKAGIRVALIDGGLDSKQQDNDTTGLDSSLTTSNAYDLLRKSTYVFNKTFRLLKIRSNIDIIQSLAKGGLSEIWHGICDYLTPSELEKVGLPVLEIQKEYQEIARRIKLQLNPRLDSHQKLLLKTFRARPFRSGTMYKVPMSPSYKASVTLDELRSRKNFTYVPNQLVFHLKEGARSVEVKSFSIDTSVGLRTRADYVILAAGSINTTRILLRSFELFNYKTPFFTKPHYLIACLHLRTLFKRSKMKKTGTGQVVIASKNMTDGLENFFIQFYRANPLAMHKALKYIPLPKVVASTLLFMIQHTLVIADIRFPGIVSRNKFCRLRKGSGEVGVLEIVYKETRGEKNVYKRELRSISRQIRKLGLLPVRTVSDYMTAHYAGGILYQDTPGMLSTDMNRKLHQARRIYVADSATWKALPAKAPTFTIMANASMVGKIVLKRIQRTRS